MRDVEEAVLVGEVGSPQEGVETHVEADFQRIKSLPTPDAPAQAEM